MLRLGATNLQRYCALQSAQYGIFAQGGYQTSVTNTVIYNLSNESTHVDSAATGIISDPDAAGAIYSFYNNTISSSVQRRELGVPD